MKILLALYIITASMFGERKTQWSAVILACAVILTGCSTANNYKLPPWEVKRVEMKCDRKTTGLPHGLVCVCRQYGSTWDCQVARIE
jgi:hypothetical protein